MKMCSKGGECKLYKIMLKKHSNNTNDFDEVFEIISNDVPIFTYSQYMDKPYYFGRLVKIVDGKEERIASFCNSEYAKQK